MVDTAEPNAPVSAYQSDVKGATRHLTWENFHGMIAAGVPAIHRVAGAPLVDIFVAERGLRIGLRTPLSGDTSAPPSPLTAVSVQVAWYEGVRYLEVTTSQDQLYPEFYSFATTLADRIQLRAEAAIEAFTSALASWSELLQPVTVLSIDRQLGLFGELWVLDRVIESRGARALESWTGPLGEPHDFRFGKRELEVKATINPTRSHIIDGENQLLASPDCSLCLLSIQLEPAGIGGSSLAELVMAVRGHLGKSPAEVRRLDEILPAVGYRIVDSGLYQHRWQLRSTPYLIVVDEQCPRITRADLEEINPVTSVRISEVHYRINVEGMGEPFEGQVVVNAFSSGTTDVAN